MAYPSNIPNESDSDKLVVSHKPIGPLKQSDSTAEVPSCTGYQLRYGLQRIEKVQVINNDLTAVEGQALSLSPNYTSLSCLSQKHRKQLTPSANARPSPLAISSKRARWAASGSGRKRNLEQREVRGSIILSCTTQQDGW